MLPNREVFESLVRQSMHQIFQKNSDSGDGGLLSLRDELTYAQRDSIVEKIAMNILAVFDQWIGGNAALLSDDGVNQLKNIIVTDICEKTLMHIHHEMQKILAASVKRNASASYMTLFNEWTSKSHTENSLDNCIQKGLTEGLQTIADKSLFEPTAASIAFTQDMRNHLQQSADKTISKLKSTESYPNIDDAKSDLENPSNSEFKSAIIKSIANSTYALIAPYQDLLTFSQTRETIYVVQQMLTAYILDDLGKNAILFTDPNDQSAKNESDKRRFVHKILSKNIRKIQIFLALHIELLTSFGMHVQTMEQENYSKDKLVGMIRQMAQFTSIAGDAISNSPGIHSHSMLSPVKINELSHLSAGGGDAYAIGSGISVLAIPAEYIIAKLRGQTPPEMTKDKALRSTAKSVSFGLVVAATCVPHIAATLAVVGAAVGMVSVVGSSAYHYYEETKLRGLIDELQKTRIPHLEKLVDVIVKNLKSLATISDQINAGVLFSKREIKHFMKEVNRVKDQLNMQMAKLKTEINHLGQAVYKLQKDFSAQDHVKAATSVSISATYLAGTAMELVPILSVAGNALMVASDICSLTYTAANTANAALSKSTMSSQQQSTLFHYPANREDEPDKKSSENQNDNQPKRASK